MELRFEEFGGFFLNALTTCVLNTLEALEQSFNLYSEFSNFCIFLFYCLFLIIFHLGYCLFEVTDLCSEFLLFNLLALRLNFILVLLKFI